jgi:ATP-binding cassette subfamily B protein
LAPATSISSFDPKDAMSSNRLLGLWQMMKGFRLKYLGATLGLALAATSKTATYLLLRYYVDDVLGQGEPAGTLLLIALGFVGLALFEGTFTFLSGRLAAQTAEGIALRLRNYLFDHIQRLPFAYHDHTQTGELIQRSTSDVDALRRFFADQAIGVGRIVLLFAINLAVLLNLNWKLALFSVIVVPLVVLISIFFFKRVSKAYEAYQEQEATLSSTLQENLTGVRVVKAFARQAYERDRFEAYNWEKFQRGRRLLMMH